jgi:hypothetical protein
LGGEGGDAIKHLFIVLQLYTCEYIYIYIYQNIYIYISEYIYIIKLYAHTNIYVCVYIYTYIHTYIYINTYRTLLLSDENTIFPILIKTVRPGETSPCLEREGGMEGTEECGGGGEG